MDFYDRLFGKFGNLTSEQERDVQNYYNHLRRRRTKMTKGICDPPSMFMLAQAVASLDSAAETHKTGSIGWEMIKNVQELAEELLVHDVNNTWPTEETEAQHNGA